MVRNIVSVVVGLFTGGLINMLLIYLGGQLIPPPEGVDVTNMESLAKAMPLFTPKNFIFPFLAHAVGTFFGALVACLISQTADKWVALIIGVFFLLGGIANSYMLPAPLWFIILDLAGAYIPMAWLGWVLSGKE